MGGGGAQGGARRGERLRSCQQGSAHRATAGASAPRAARRPHWPLPNHLVARLTPTRNAPGPLPRPASCRCSQPPPNQTPLPLPTPRGHHCQCPPGSPSAAPCICTRMSVRQYLPACEDRLSSFSSSTCTVRFLYSACVGKGGGGRVWRHACFLLAHLQRLQQANRMAPGATGMLW